MWILCIDTFSIMSYYQGGGTLGCLLQSFILYLINFGDFYWVLIGWFIRLGVHVFQKLIVIYRTGNFVNNHWGCTTICWKLFYPFRSLHIIDFKKSILSIHTYMCVNILTFYVFQINFIVVYTTIKKMPPLTKFYLV